jgi:uncharacterized membrane protein YjjP (DUF1212 family)
MIFGLVITAGSFVIQVIGLVGVIKENRCVVITITVLSAIGVVCSFISGGIGGGILGVLVTGLMGFYAYLIVQKEKKNPSA